MTTKNYQIREEKCGPLAADKVSMINLYVAKTV